MKKNRNEQDQPEAPKHRSKKNTKRWCKGKVGREHKPTWKKSIRYSNFGWLDYTCDNCGKSYQMWFSSLGFGERWEKPEIGSTEPLKRKEKT